MPRLLTAVGVLALVLSATLPAAPPAQSRVEGPAPSGVQGPQSAPPAPSVVEGRGMVNRYCVSCHNERLKTAELMLDKVDFSDVAGNREVLEKVVRKLRKGLMPPQGAPRPDAATLDAFTGSLEGALDRVALASPTPGRVASRRLNRSEYVNVVRDLLVLDVDGAALLPPDMAGFGFDNNADVLAITPALMDRYITAATKISRLAVGSPDNRPMMSVYKMEFGTRQDARMGEALPFATKGGMAVRHTFPLDGEYAFAVRLRKNDTVSTIDGIEEEHQIELRIDHALIKRFTIGGKFTGPDPGVLIAVPEDDIEGQKVHDYRVNADKELEIRVPVKAGTRLVSVAFTDSKPSPDIFANARRGGVTSGNLFGSILPGIDQVFVSGPFNGTVPQETPSRKQIFTCQQAARRDEEPCARKILTTLARRAYRRPVGGADVQPLLAIYNEGARERDFEFGIERALEALLSSPKFLIRIEREPAQAKPGTVYRLNDLELASRLSFFLWKSIPDDELLEVAERGRLKDPAVLAQQVRRMLADRRSTRFMNDFVGQWLTIRNISSSTPDARLFPDFDPTLRNAMLRETELFFESQVREDRPIPELLTANYSFLNERLARHYGVGSIYGSHFRRVGVTDDRRFGLLGHGSILTVTSYADRTSVVLRGKWVLENLVGAPPPPPPAVVPPLKENQPGAKPASLRERMEAHRNNAVCASCHSRMDPLGFALEHFDAIGKWRDDDGGAEINSTIQLDGATIDSPKAFRAALGRGDQFVATVVEKLLGYALGRGVDYTDAPAIRQFVRNLAQNEFRWSSLILDVVKSPAFQMRQTVAPGQGATATTAQGQ